MDDSKKRAQGEEKAAVRPVLPADGVVPPPSPATTLSKAPLRDPAAPPADEDPVDVGGVEEDDDDDDEKVERFYALLANIRAMRGLLPPCVASTSSSCGGGGDDAAAGGGAARKRMRAAEPPWRPAFRMEDFDEAEPAAPPSKRERTRGADDADEQGESARPAVVVAPSLPHAAARCDRSSCNCKD